MRKKIKVEELEFLFQRRAKRLGSAVALAPSPWIAAWLDEHEMRRAASLARCRY
jgi:hypothetical protein